MELTRRSDLKVDWYFSAAQRAERKKQRARRREWEAIGPIYELTNGYRSGLVLARKRRTQGADLAKFRRGRVGRTTLTTAAYEAIPIVPRFIVGVFKAEKAFKNMATSAWAISSYLGCPPRDEFDATYDLLVITSLWRRIDKGKNVHINWTPIQEFATHVRDRLGDEEHFGKYLLLHLTHNGVDKVDANEILMMYTPNYAKKYIKKHLQPLVAGLARDAASGFNLDDAFDGAMELVPFVSRGWSVGKHAGRAELFQNIAVRYYNLKRGALLTEGL